MRIGLVLGAGGVVGASWLIGALQALEQQGVILTVQAVYGSAVRASEEELRYCIESVSRTSTISPSTQLRGLHLYVAEGGSTALLDVVMESAYGLDLKFDEDAAMQAAASGHTELLELVKSSGRYNWVGNPAVSRAACDNGQGQTFMYLAEQGCTCMHTDPGEILFSAAQYQDRHLLQVAELVLQNARDAHDAVGVTASNPLQAVALGLISGGRVLELRNLLSGTDYWPITVENREFEYAVTWHQSLTVVKQLLAILSKYGTAPADLILTAASKCDLAVFLWLSEQYPNPAVTAEQLLAAAAANNDLRVLKTVLQERTAAVSKEEAQQLLQIAGCAVNIHWQLWEPLLVCEYLLHTLHAPWPEVLGEINDEGRERRWPSLALDWAQDQECTSPYLRNGSTLLMSQRTSNRIARAATVDRCVRRLFSD